MENYWSWLLCDTIQYKSCLPWVLWASNSYRDTLIWVTHRGGEMRSVTIIIIKSFFFVFTIGNIAWFSVWLITDICFKCHNLSAWIYNMLSCYLNKGTTVWVWHVVVLWSVIISESKIAEVPANLRLLKGTLLNRTVSKLNQFYREITI